MTPAVERQAIFRALRLYERNLHRVAVIEDAVLPQLAKVAIAEERDNVAALLDSIVDELRTERVARG